MYIIQCEMLVNEELKILYFADVAKNHRKDVVNTFTLAFEGKKKAHKFFEREEAKKFTHLLEGDWTTSRIKIIEI